MIIMKPTSLPRTKKEMHLQEFWIKYKGSVPISDVIYIISKKLK